MSRIFITGGAGFIGSHLAGACLAEGHEVHVVVRPESNDERLWRFGGDIVRHSFDLQSDLALKRCLAEVLPEIVFHLAARPRRPTNLELTDVKDGIREHLQGLANLLVTAANLKTPPKKVIRAGSLAEYGLAPSPYREDVREVPFTVYGAELTAATHLISGLQSHLPFPVITARLALVYGSYQSTEYLVPRLIRQCLAEKPSIVRHPQDRRDLLHVDDVVDALRAIASAPMVNAPVVNIASGVAPTMREVAQLIVKLTDQDPNLVEYGSDHQSSGVADLRGSTDLAHRLFGWRARVPLHEGIERTVQWYRDLQHSETTAGDRRADPSHKHTSGAR